jgi:hypothetical protein
VHRALDAVGSDADWARRRVDRRHVGSRAAIAEIDPGAMGRDEVQWPALVSRRGSLPEGRGGQTARTSAAITVLPYENVVLTDHAAVAIARSTGAFRCGAIGRGLNDRRPELLQPATAGELPTPNGCAIDIKGESVPLLTG